MPKPKPDPWLSRGIWCLVIGIFTSWLFGIGLLFIFAAAICGFVGLFRQRALTSLLLLLVSLFVGVFCAHVAAVVGIYAFNQIKATPPAKPSPAIHKPASSPSAAK